MVSVCFAGSPQNSVVKTSRIKIVWLDIIAVPIGIFESIRRVNFGFFEVHKGSVVGVEVSV
jgi:hypothetical protein